MRKERGITLVSLVVTIIILIILAGVSINLTLGENGIITIAKQAKENTELAKIEEETMLNELYTQIESEGENSGLSYDAIMMLKEFRKKIATAITNEGVKTLETDTAETMAENIGKIKDNIIQEGATVTEDKILKDYTAYKDGKLITGTMTDNGAITKSLNAGGSYTIPEGYHNGSGKVTANSLASQTQATATAEDIAEGKTAWVEGEKVVGSGKISNNSIGTISSATLLGKAGNTTSVATFSYTSDGTYYYFICDAGQSGSITTNGNIIFQSEKYSIGGAHTHQISIIKLENSQYVTVSGWRAYLYGIK